MALWDALDLSRCITSTNFPEMQTAVAAFEGKMLERASAYAKDTMEQTAALHSKEGLEHLLKLFAGVGS